MRIHKPGFIALALGSMLAFSGLSSAQTTNSPARGQRRGSVQQRVERMDSELKLSPEQKTKVTGLFEEETKKRQELRADTSLSREEKREKGQAMMAEQQKKLKTILTPDQFAKWQKMLEEFRARRSEAQSSDKNKSSDKKAQ